MSEQPVDDPVREASSRLVQTASLAAMAAEALTQARQSRAAARNTADAHATVTDRVQRGVAQAAARVAWAPLLQRGLRAHLSDDDVVQGRAAADLWSPGIWEAGRASEHAQRRQAATQAPQHGESAGDRSPTAAALALPAAPAAPSPTTTSDCPAATAARDSESPPPSVTPAARAPLVVAPSPDGSAPALATVTFPEPLTGTVLTRSGVAVHDAGATHRPSAVALTPGLHQPNGLTR